MLLHIDGSHFWLTPKAGSKVDLHIQVPAAQRGTALVACPRRDLNLIFSLQFERSANRDNTVSFQNLILQIERVSWQASLTGCNVTVHPHLDQTLRITYGPHRLECFTAQGEAMTETKPAAGKAMEKTCPQLRRRLDQSNHRTFHLLQPPDNLICQEQPENPPTCGYPHIY
jgi:hypothetical protein